MGKMREAVSDARAALGVRYGGTPVNDSGAKESQHELVVPTSRIERLTDGIFAIAMTLLVVGIQVPTFSATITAVEFSAYVSSILQIATYVISFVLLAVFWLDHHIFFRIKRATATLT